MAKNNFGNGKWNILTVYYTKQMKSLSIRHFVPLLFLLSLIVPLVMMLFYFSAVIISMTSRHRGAKPPRRYELLGGISLLSPEYLLSFERRSFHTHPPDHYAPVSCLLGMSASQSSALMPLHSLRSVTNRPEGTFGSLRYAFGGDHPSQTTHQAVSSH